MQKVFRNSISKADTRLITYGIALPKGDSHLANWLGNFLSCLDKVGFLAGLREKWFGQPTRLPLMK